MKKLFAMLMTVVCGLSIASNSTADPVNGTQQRVGMLNPGERTFHVFVLRGGEMTIIDIDGAGLGDIDCVLSDAGDNDADDDTRDIDGCHLAVTPIRTGSFTVYMMNRGRNRTAYTLQAY